jgi:hypothetical protein
MLGCPSAFELEPHLAGAESVARYIQRYATVALLYRSGLEPR